MSSVGRAPVRIAIRDTYHYTVLMMSPSKPPAGNPRSFRLSDQELELLDKLQDRLRSSQSDVLRIALTHLWTSLERDERIHLVLDESGGKGRPTASR